MIKAVFFDLYNTLVGFYPPRQVVQAEAGRSFGLDLEPGGILRGYVDADNFMTHQNARKHYGRLNSVDQAVFFARYEQLVLHGAGVEADVDFAGRMWERVQQIPYKLIPYDDAVPALNAIRARGLKTGAISNLDVDLENLSKELGLGTYLDCKVSSRIAGAEKPDPRIFRFALDRLGVRPEEAIHVGDQYHGDVVGARAAGMGAVLLDRDGLLTNYTDVDRIQGLGEVLKFVGQPAQRQ